jgi:hypothetical protein
LGLFWAVMGRSCAAGLYLAALGLSQDPLGLSLATLDISWEPAGNLLETCWSAGNLLETCCWKPAAGNLLKPARNLLGARWKPAGNLLETCCRKPAAGNLLETCWNPATGNLLETCWKPAGTCWKLLLYHLLFPSNKRKESKGLKQVVPSRACPRS